MVLPDWLYEPAAFVGEAEGAPEERAEWQAERDWLSSAPRLRGFGNSGEKNYRLATYWIQLALNTYLVQRAGYGLEQ